MLGNEFALDVIAERVLEVVGDGDARLTVRLGKPVPNAEGGDYACPCQFSGLGLDTTKVVFGCDAMQAIQLAFVVIGGYLAFVERTKGVKLSWLDGDVGFPRP